MTYCPEPMTPSQTDRETSTKGHAVPPAIVLLIYGLVLVALGFPSEPADKAVASVGFARPGKIIDQHGNQPGILEELDRMQQEEELAQRRQAAFEAGQLRSEAMNPTVELPKVLDPRVQAWIDANKEDPGILGEMARIAEVNPQLVTPGWREAAMKRVGTGPEMTWEGQGPVGFWEGMRREFDPSQRGGGEGLPFVGGVKTTVDLSKFIWAARKLQQWQNGQLTLSDKDYNDYLQVLQDGVVYEEYMRTRGTTWLGQLGAGMADLVGRGVEFVATAGPGTIKRIGQAALRAGLTS